MGRKLLKRLLECMIAAMIICSSVGCGQKEVVDSNKESVIDVTIATDVSGTEVTDEILEDTSKNIEEINFSDFLVERCIRKTLNKDWGEKVTKADVEKIKSLLIDNTFNPSMGICTLVTETFSWYNGYIDLSDLKYLTNLEILQVDNAGGLDLVTNIDAITNCKKLKKIYICSSSEAYQRESVEGYKYWADIIAQLPELEYVDLGIYIDSHMKEIMLSKTSNKQIEFYNGENDSYYTSSALRTFQGFSIIDVSAYTDTMKYEYNGNESRNDSSSLRHIPFFWAKTELELQDILSSMDKNIEDICLQISDEIESFDCSLLREFKNLITLTIFRRSQPYKYQRDKDRCFELKNAETLAELQYLQVLNLGGLKGNIDGIGKISKLRELTLYSCHIDSIDFMNNLKNLTELKLLYINGDCKEKGLENVAINLKNLTYYECCSEESFLSGIDMLEKLETLYYECGNQICSLNTISKCKSLKNLYIEAGSYKKDSLAYDLNMITTLNNLEKLCIRRNNVVNIEKILNMNNLKIIVTPYAIKGMDEETFNHCVNKASLNENLSVFDIVPVYGNYSIQDMEKFNKQSLKNLYNKGIHDGLVQEFINEYHSREEYKNPDYEYVWSEISRRHKNSISIQKAN